ncbi:MAG TPA: hypothetical protein VM406_02965 [Noviherbaspirillum sp.]|nr:hypothetical protein [Noviherbaspirillum sp.]
MTDRDEDRKERDPNPMDHPEEQPVEGDGSPKFGRLLLVLLGAIVLVILITLASEAIYS